MHRLVTELLCFKIYYFGTSVQVMEKTPPVGYETIMMNDPDHQGDIDTAPTDGFDDKREDKSSVSTVSKVSLSAPIRFSQASFIQIERERMDHGKATIFNTPKKEATVNVDFDVDAQLKNITDNIR